MISLFNRLRNHRYVNVSCVVSFCSEIFDDYRNKRNLKYHKALVLNRKEIPYEFLGAPSNRFARLDNSKDNLKHVIKFVGKIRFSAPSEKNKNKKKKKKPASYATGTVKEAGMRSISGSRVEGCKRISFFIPV